MPDRTQTLSVNGLTREEIEAVTSNGPGQEPGQWRANRDSGLEKLRTALSQPEHQGDEQMPYVCPECNHSIAPGAMHGRGCSRHPGNAYGSLQAAVGRCSLAGITRDVMHQVVENFSADDLQPPTGEVERPRERSERDEIKAERDAHWRKLEQVHVALEAIAAQDARALLAALDDEPPPSDSQGDQERCGGSGKIEKLVELDDQDTPCVDIHECPGCPDCNPAPTDQRRPERYDAAKEEWVSVCDPADHIWDEGDAGAVYCDNCAGYFCWACEGRGVKDGQGCSQCSKWGIEWFLESEDRRISPTNWPRSEDSEGNPAPTQVEGDECERCKGTGSIAFEDYRPGDHQCHFSTTGWRCSECEGTGKRQPEGGDEEDWPRALYAIRTATGTIRATRCVATGDEFCRYVLAREKAAKPKEGTDDQAA